MNAFMLSCFHASIGLNRLEGGDIQCDLHWIGDGYLDPVWQSNMLAKRTMENSVFRPNSEDAFFSLICSEYVHRQNERPEKIERIKRVSQELSHTGWLTEDLFKERGKVLRVLAGYMKVCGYYWVPPLVERYAQPLDAVTVLPKPDVPLSARKPPFLFRLGVRVARRLLPPKMRQAISMPVRRLFKL